MIVLLLHFMFVMLFYSQVGSLVMDFVSWHDIFSGENVTETILWSTIYSGLFLFILPMYYYYILNQYYSESTKEHATDLWYKFEKFNTSSSIFEREI